MSLDSIPDWVAWLAQDVDGALWGIRFHTGFSL